MEQKIPDTSADPNQNVTTTASGATSVALMTMAFVSRCAIPSTYNTKDMYAYRPHRAPTTFSCSTSQTIQLQAKSSIGTLSPLIKRNLIKSFI